MFLRSTNRKKDGKDHRYFSVVENRRVSAGKTVQRTVVYLGEINDTQRTAWLKTLKVFDEEEQRHREVSLFPDDRAVPSEAVDRVQVKGQRAGAAPSPCLRQLLVGLRAVARTRAGGVLAAPVAGRPRSRAVGAGTAAAGGEPVDRAGQ